MINKIQNVQNQTNTTFGAAIHKVHTKFIDTVHYALPPKVEKEFLDELVIISEQSKLEPDVNQIFPTEYSFLISSDQNKIKKGDCLDISKTLEPSLSITTRFNKAYETIEFSLDKNAKPNSIEEKINKIIVSLHNSFKNLGQKEGL